MLIIVLLPGWVRFRGNGRGFETVLDIKMGGHQGLQNSKIGKKIVVEYEILMIFRRNDGILHPCCGRIFSKMMHWIRNFDKVIRICGILHLLSYKTEFWLKITGTADFSWKLRGTADFYPSRDQHLACWAFDEILQIIIAYMFREQ